MGTILRFAEAVHMSHCESESDLKSESESESESAARVGFRGKSSGSERRPLSERCVLWPLWPE
jgi:hypothetical protein